METYLDECVLAVAATVAAYRHPKQRINNIDQLALLVLVLLDQEDVIMSQGDRRTYM